MRKPPTAVGCPSAFPERAAAEGSICLSEPFGGRVALALGPPPPPFKFDGVCCRNVERDMAVCWLGVRGGAAAAGRASGGG